MFDVERKDICANVNVTQNTIVNVTYEQIFSLGLL